LDYRSLPPANSLNSPANLPGIPVGQQSLPFNRLIPALPAAGTASDLGWYPVADSNAGANQETEGGNQQQTPPTSTNPPAEQPPANANTATPPVAGNQSPAETTTPAAPETAPITRGRFEFELNFDNQLSGQAIVTQLIEVSERMDMPIEEESVRIATDNPDPDENPYQALSNKWKLSFESNRAEDAEKVMAKWSEELNGKVFFPTISGVGGQVAQDAQWQAIAAIFASLVGIIIYIWIRFQNVAYGLAAVVALIHDVLVVLGAIALSHYLAGPLGFLQVVEFKLSLSVLAAILTVIGYSLNDTIVIFDRIREQRGKRIELTSDMINQSVSQTLSRTILTSFTTLLVVVVLYFFGGDSIHGFAFALVVGVTVGTYSSIFIASPVLLYLMNRAGLNENLAAAKAGNG
jgi:SecD/SecF fusion protein